VRAFVRARSRQRESARARACEREMENHACVHASERACARIGVRGRAYKEAFVREYV